MNITHSNSLMPFWLEAKFDFLSVLRAPGFVLPSLLFPCVFYIFFGILFNHGNASSYLMVNYCVFGIMGPALFNFGVNVAQDKENGCLALKKLSPMPSIAYVLAKSSTALCFSAVITLLLFTLGLAFAEVSLSLSQWFQLFFVALLGTFPFCLLGLFLGLSVPSKGAPATVNLVYLPMSLCSGLWMPINLFPELLQQFAWILPSYHLSQLGLDVIDASQGYPPSWHIGYLIVFSVLFIFMTSKQMQKQ
ncbi:ABC transporter permease [Pseudoalteromonas xiamenensis]|uniref:ABC transporter permease n=1 Tax=Pseudoalteromonas xiamenensis TaxID=882626 RepID=UPI0027E3D9D3|nr:ABC transporter permease [Pseudoalteromonas xiamenensis]WMN59153.1 ABC transporter permease [Pseudoalteromonas xiamenensis]